MRARTVAIAGVALLMGACGDESMRDQPRGNVFKANPLFADGAATRSWPVGTVAREPTPYEADDEGVMAPRPKVTMQELLLGQDRFITFCSPCHGEDG